MDSGKGCVPSHEPGLLLTWKLFLIFFQLKIILVAPTQPTSDYDGLVSFPDHSDGSHHFARVEAL
jgi:hypothetical protein